MTSREKVFVAINRVFEVSSRFPYVFCVFEGLDVGQVTSFSRSLGIEPKIHAKAKENQSLYPVYIIIDDVVGVSVESLDMSNVLGSNKHLSIPEFTVKFQRLKQVVKELS